MLELVLLQRLERRGARAQDIVFGFAVEDMNSSVVKKGRLGKNPARCGRADGATGQGLRRHFLHRLEAMSLAAFVFVERHIGAQIFIFSFPSDARNS